MLKNRKELIELIEFGYDIKEIINSWDPMGLMEFCPEDEYEAEIKGLRKLLGKEIRKLFRFYFSNRYNSKRDVEENIAGKIIEKSKKYKLSCTVSNYYDIENIIFKNEKEIEIYINLYIKINKIINSWDPLKIMDISFSNEYSYEINRIIEELLKNITIQNLSKEINKVFKNAYNGLYKIEKNEEIEITEKIFEEYNNISKL